MNCWHLGAIKRCDNDIKEFGKLLKARPSNKADVRECLHDARKARDLYILVHRQDCKGADVFYEINKFMNKRWIND